MVIYYESNTTDELYHHGIKGMRWGVRRYQNKDGSLTANGKKHRSLGQVVKDYRTKKKRKAALEKARQTKAANKEAAEKRKKAIESGRLSPKKMTDQELKTRMERLRLEQDYTDLINKTSKSATTRGKHFVDKFLDSAIDKIADNAAADIVAQGVKVFTAKGANKVINTVLNTEGTDYVFANNKKK